MPGATSTAATAAAAAAATMARIARRRRERLRTPARTRSTKWSVTGISHSGRLTTEDSSSAIDLTLLCGWTTKRGQPARDLGAHGLRAAAQLGADLLVGQ